MERLTTKCATILIATKRRTTVYHSVEEVPDALRAKLLESTHGINSATILIADKGGREELLGAMHRERPDRYSRLLTALTAAKARSRTRHPAWVYSLPIVGRVLLVGCLGYVLWVLATLH